MRTVEVDPVQNTKAGRAKRCEAFARALHQAFLDGDAPLPSLFLKTDGPLSALCARKGDVELNANDLFGIKVLNQARKQDANVPWLANETKLLRVAMKLGISEPQKAAKIALRVAKRMRRIRDRILKENDGYRFDVISAKKAGAVSAYINGRSLVWLMLP